MIDTSTWVKFKLSDIGFTNYHGIRQTKADREEGDIPLLTAGKENQGVSSYISNAPAVYADAITVDMFGNSFFHKGNYAGDDNIYFFVNDKISDNAKLFIAAILNANNSKIYAYKEQFRQPQADALSVSLPATSEGQPDWEYMESYMKAVMEESEKALSNLKKADDTKHLIDVSGWGKFDIAKLFNISLPKGDLQVKKVDDGDIPLITPSNFNNGMLQRISKYSPSTLYGKGSLTVDMFGNAYYQEEDFFVTAHGHVNVLLPNMSLNIYTGSFLASAIRTMLFDKYGFSEMCTQKVLKAESVWLPITSAGEPDWQYMEDYMKNIMNKQEMAADSLSKIA